LIEDQFYELTRNNPDHTRGNSSDNSVTAVTQGNSSD